MIREKMFMLTAQGIDRLLAGLGQLGIPATVVWELFLATAVGVVREAAITREEFDKKVTEIWDQWTREMGDKRS